MQIDQVELVKKAKAGQDHAFEELFQHLHQPILNYVYRMVGDRQRAEDVTQEAFIRAHEKLDQLGPPYDFKSWVYRIAGNMAHYELRSRKPERALDLEGADKEVGKVAERPAEQGALRHERGEGVWEVLEDLPPDYRQALILREFNELSYKEMTQALERSYDSVRQLVHRARVRFMETHISQAFVTEGPIRCAVLGDLLSAQRDGELSPSENQRVQAHLSQCVDCQRTEDRLRQVGTALAALPLLTPSQHWVEETLRRIAERAGEHPEEGVQQQADQNRLKDAAVDTPSVPSVIKPLLAWGIGMTALLASGAAFFIAGAVATDWLMGRNESVSPEAISSTTDTVPPTRSPTVEVLSGPAGTTPTESPAGRSPSGRVGSNANCRSGPGQAYPVRAYLTAGDVVSVLGRNEASTWWLVTQKGSNRRCWIWDGLIDIEGTSQTIPIKTPPPEPTWTLTPTPTPTATSTPSPPSKPTNFHISSRTCTSSAYQITLMWVDTAGNESGYRLFRDGTLLAILPADTVSYLDDPPRGSPVVYDLEAFNDGGASGQTRLTEKGCSKP